MRNKPDVAKTADQVRAEFNRLGVSMAAWARQHQVGRSLLYEVLAGRKKCKRGDSHKIAVLLGLKTGSIVERPDAVNVPQTPPARGAA